MKNGGAILFLDTYLIIKLFSIFAIILKTLKILIVPLFSVLIPIYNSEKYLERCINSVLEAKKNFNIEIILINDGSTDNSLSIIKKIQQNYDFIKIINQKNKGLSGARNAGLKIAKGKFISFVDSDDTIIPNYFEFLLPFIDKEFNMIEFGFSRIENENKISTLPLNKTYNREEILNQLTFSTKNRIHWFVWKRIYRNSYLKKFKISFNERIRFGEDTDFSLKVFKHLNKYKSLNKSLYYYYETDDSLTSKKFKNNLLQKYELQYKERKNFIFPEINKKLQWEDIANNYINHSLFSLLLNLKNHPNKIDEIEELKKIRSSIIYKECFKHYKFNWKHPKKSFIVLLFKKKKFKTLKIIFLKNA